MFICEVVFVYACRHCLRGCTTEHNVCVCVQMDLRDQETAAAVQDLEVRQMELEAQRKLLEQVGQPGEHCSSTGNTAPAQGTLL